MSRLRNASIYGVLALVASLALARIHPFGNANLYPANSANAPILNSAQVPPQVRAILVEKCADCHSNQTRAPFYGHLAPASWLMERDIVEARRAMNLSLWDTYPDDQQRALAAMMVKETRSHRMAPPQYRIIHWNARIGDADGRILSQWAHGPQSIPTGATVAAGGDAVRGKALFEKRCIGCHELTRNREGPQLQKVYGRTSGTAPHFAYSSALKNAQIVWDDQSLERWLTDPDAFIPGNDMDFLVSKPQDRRDLIRYLKQSAED